MSPALLYTPNPSAHPEGFPPLFSISYGMLTPSIPSSLLCAASHIPFSLTP